MTITIFGNKFVKKDSLLVSILPILKKTFPHHKFIHQDPTENLIIPKDKWLILDIAEGLDKITEFINLDAFKKTRSTTTHDYDLITELLLLEKLNKLPKYIIIAFPIKISQKEIIKYLKERY